MKIKYISFIIILIIFSSQAISFAYTPPIGIPEPSFGINEPTYNSASHCPNWPSENSKSNGQSYDCYYVDNSASCDDSNAGGYGTPTAPRCTIPSTTFTAGAFVDIRGTGYTTGDRFRFRGQGTATDYILISGKNASTNPVLNKWVCIGCLAVDTTSYIIMENLTVNTTNGGVSIRSESGNHPIDHIAVRNNKIDGLVGGVVTNGGGQTFTTYGGGETAKVTDIVFYKNAVEHAGNWNRDGVADEAIAYHVVNYAEDIWILENTAWRIGNCGAGHAHGGNRTAKRIYVGGNDFSEGGKSLIDFKEVGDELIISQNTLHNPMPPNHGISNGQAIVLHYGPNYGPEKTWVLFNDIYTADVGIQMSSYVGDAYIIGNKLHDLKQRCSDVTTSPWTILDSGNASCTENHGATRDDLSDSGARGVGVVLWSVTGNLYIVDNTFSGYEKGVAIDNGLSGSYFYLSGNIFTGRTQSLGYDLEVGSPTRATIGKNLFYYNAENNTRYSWGAAIYTGLSSFQSGAGIDVCTNCLESDPLLDSTLGLYQSSPAIDQNSEHALYSTFLTEFGLSINYDNAGRTHSRPQGLSWDLGAEEYYEDGGDTTPPIISSPLPSGAQSCTSNPRNVTLQVTTDEAATCKYGTSDVSYASLPNTFSTTGSTTHSQTVSNACGSSYTYYVRCQDGSGNPTLTSTAISYSVATAGTTLYLPWRVATP